MLMALARAIFLRLLSNDAFIILYATYLAIELVIGCFELLTSLIISYWSWVLMLFLCAM
jgi:hypothetical protein